MEIESLYQELIIDHGTNPRQFFQLESANCTAEGYNPLCGDKVIIYLNVENNIITKATFTGSGCAISTASASLMCEALAGKNIDEVLKLSTTFKSLLVTGTKETAPVLGKLAAFSGVNAYPARVKCATLAWHTLEAAIAKDSQKVTTESSDEVFHEHNY